MNRCLLVVLSLLVLLLESRLEAQGFPFPPTKTRTPTRTPAVLPTVAGPTTTPTAVAPTRTATPVPSASSDCLVPWPTTTPGQRVQIDYAWTAAGACLTGVYDDVFGATADIYLSVNGGPWRRLVWRVAGCWAYEDGSIQYALPRVGQPWIHFSIECRKGGSVHPAGIQFPPPSYSPT